MGVTIGLGERAVVACEKCAKMLALALFGQRCTCTFV